MDFHIFRLKSRHKLRDFYSLNLKLDLFKVQTGSGVFRYEMVLSEKKKFDLFKKIAKLKVEDTDRLVKLFKEVDKYLKE